MSDHYYCFIPTDPSYVPAQKAREAAVDALQSALPYLQDVEAIVEPRVGFFDCGENFLEVRCPNCDRPIEMHRWTGWLDADAPEQDGFRLDSYEMPCCGARFNLNELVYNGPAGFSRFALRGRNSAGEVAPDLVANLQRVLGCRLKVIYIMY